MIIPVPGKYPLMEQAGTSSWLKLLLHDSTEDSRAQKQLSGLGDVAGAEVRTKLG